MFNPNEFKCAFETVVAVMREGEATHLPDEWKTYPPEFHAARAFEHLRSLREGDTRKDHLSHATTRLMLALTLRDVS
jgi:hypothetical protein